MMRKHQYYK